MDGKLKVSCIFGKVEGLLMLCLFFDLHKLPFSVTINYECFIEVESDILK